MHSTNVNYVQECFFFTPSKLHPTSHHTEEDLTIFRLLSREDVI